MLLYTTWKNIKMEFLDGLVQQHGGNEALTGGYVVNDTPPTVVLSPTV